MEKDFLAGQGERKRITSIQFCSDSTLPAHQGPATHIPPTGLAWRQDSGAWAAPQELPVLWKHWRQVDTELQQCLWGSAFLPPDPWGRWPVVAERNTEMGLESTAPESWFDTGFRL